GRPADGNHQTDAASGICPASARARTPARPADRTGRPGRPSATRSPCWPRGGIYLTCRQKMARIGRVGSEVALFVDGRRHQPSGGTYPVINPATEEVVGQAPDAGPGQVREATTVARRAFPSWSRTRPEERAEILGRVADLLQKQADELVGLVQAETGAT